MREKKVVPAYWVQTGRDQSARSGDKSINDDRDSARCRTENQAGDASDFKAADLGENIKTVVRIRLVQLDCSSYDTCLVSQLFVIHSCASADGLFHRRSCQYGEDCSTRGRVPNTHVACSDEIVSLRKIDAGLDRSNRLVPRHRRSLEKVFRTPRDLPVHQAIQVAEIMIDTHVHDNVFDSIVAA